MYGAGYELVRFFGVGFVGMSMIGGVLLGVFFYWEHTEELAQERQKAAMVEAITSIREGRPGRTSAAARTARAQERLGRAPKALL